MDFSSRMRTKDSHLLHGKWGSPGGGLHSSPLLSRRRKAGLHYASFPIYPFISRARRVGVVTRGPCWGPPAAQEAVLNRAFLKSPPFDIIKSEASGARVGGLCGEKRQGSGRQAASNSLFLRKARRDPESKLAEECNQNSDCLDH